jgi:hypothetical protein
MPNSTMSPLNARAVMTGAPLTTRNRPRGYAALAVALIIGLGALGYYFYTSAGHKVPVVMAVHDIPAGHVITRSDLTTIEVAGDVTAIAGSGLTSLVDKQAAVEILPNTIIQSAMIASGPTIAAGQVLVGLTVGISQLPSVGLRPGDKVTVIALGAKGDASVTTATVLINSAVVYDSRSNSAGGGAVLTLIVAPDMAPAVALGSSQGTIAVVKIVS